MPSKHRKKVYTAGGWYHLFNRGTNRQTIFHSNKDYLFYRQCLYEYLTPKRSQIKNLQSKGYSEETLDRKLRYLSELKNYSQEIKLVAFTLMPNHIHLQVRQKERYSIVSFIRSLHTRYAIYHSKKHGTIGPLFQGRYKATHRQDDSFILKVSKYIHLNPRDIGQDPFNYRWSSLRYYKAQKTPSWIDTETIIKKFQKHPYAKRHSAYLTWIRTDLPNDGPAP